MSESAFSPATTLGVAAMFGLTVAASCLIQRIPSLQSLSDGQDAAKEVRSDLPGPLQDMAAGRLLKIIQPAVGSPLLHADAVRVLQEARVAMPNTSPYAKQIDTEVAAIHKAHPGLPELPPYCKTFDAACMGPSVTFLRAHPGW